MGQRFTLSFSDIKMANLAYNCDGIVQMGETIFSFLNNYLNYKIKLFYYLNEYFNLNDYVIFLFNYK